VVPFSLHFPDKGWLPRCTSQTPVKAAYTAHCHPTNTHKHLDAKNMQIRHHTIASRLQQTPYQVCYHGLAATSTDCSQTPAHSPSAFITPMFPSCVRHPQFRRCILAYHITHREHSHSRAVLYITACIATTDVHTLSLQFVCWACISNFNRNDALPLLTYTLCPCSLSAGHVFQTSTAMTDSCPSANTLHTRPP
jgi:hypothetical protein